MNLDINLNAAETDDHHVLPEGVYNAAGKINISNIKKIDSVGCPGGPAALCPPDLFNNHDNEMLQEKTVDANDLNNINYQEVQLHY